MVSATPSFPPQPFLARLAAASSTALFLVFAASVASVALPVKLLEMAWQLKAINAIINNGTIPLVGLVLIHLAAYLDPSQPRFEARCQAVRRWAIPVTLGFLLLVPLQARNLYQGLANARANEVSQQLAISQGFRQLREAITTAPTTGELQNRLQALKGPVLSAADSAQPLAALRRQLLSALQQAEANAKAARSGVGPEQRWAFVADMARSIVSSLAYALAFAAGAKRSRSPHSLLTQFSDGLGSLFTFRPGAFKKRMEAYQNAQKVSKDRDLSRQRMQEHQRQMDKANKEKEKRVREALRKQQKH